MATLDLFGKDKKRKDMSTDKSKPDDQKEERLEDYLKKQDKKF